MPFAGSVGPASAKRLNSYLMAFLSASTGTPGGADGTCVAPSLSSSGLSFIPFPLPLRGGGDIVSLHHATPSQVICFSSGFYHCPLEPFHMSLSAELARQRHSDFALILVSLCRKEE